MARTSLFAPAIRAFSVFTNLSKRFMPLFDIISCSRLASLLKRECQSTPQAAVQSMTRA